MSYRCFVFKNQSQTVRGYLSAIKFFHKMYAGWELPTTHCMVLAVGKGIDRFQGKGDVKPRVRKPLSWDMLWDGKNEVLTAEGGGPVMWMGLALAYFLLCRASELFAYDSGMVHPDYCLTRRDLTFFKGVQQVKWVDRREADKVEICFRASKADQKRIGAVVARTRVQQTEKRRGREVGALEILLDLIDTHPDLDMTAPDAVMYYVRMEGHYAVGSDTSLTVVGKLRRERALAVRPTLGENRRRHALGSARGVGTADSESRALEVVGFYGAR